VLRKDKVTQCVIDVTSGSTAQSHIRSRLVPNVASLHHFHLWRSESLHLLLTYSWPAPIHSVFNWFILWKKI